MSPLEAFRLLQSYLKDRDSMSDDEYAELEEAVQVLELYLNG